MDRDALARQGGYKDYASAPAWAQRLIDGRINTPSGAATKTPAPGTEATPQPQSTTTRPQATATPSPTAGGPDPYGGLTSDRLIAQGYKASPEWTVYSDDPNLVSPYTSYYETHPGSGIWASAAQEKTQRDAKIPPAKMTGVSADYFKGLGQNAWQATNFSKSVNGKFLPTYYAQQDAAGNFINLFRTGEQMKAATAAKAITPTGAATGAATSPPAATATPPAATATPATTPTATATPATTGQPSGQANAQQTAGQFGASGVGDNSVSGLKQFASYAEKDLGIPTGVLSSLIQHESSWNPNAQNATSGATGLGQLMPSNFAAYGVTADELKNNPQRAISIAAQMLADGYRKYGDAEKALGAYAFGQSNVDKAIAQGGDWKANLDAISGQYGAETGNPAQPWARAYIDSVMGNTGSGAASGTTATPQQQPQPTLPPPAPVSSAPSSAFPGFTPPTGGARTGFPSQQPGDVNIPLYRDQPGFQSPRTLGLPTIASSSPGSLSVVSPQGGWGVNPFAEQAGKAGQNTSGYGAEANALGSFNIPFATPPNDRTGSFSPTSQQTAFDKSYLDNPYSADNPIEQARLAGTLVKPTSNVGNAYGAQGLVANQSYKRGGFVRSIQQPPIQQTDSMPPPDAAGQPRMFAHGGGLIISHPAHITDDATGQPLASLSEVRPEQLTPKPGGFSIANHVPGMGRYAGGGTVQDRPNFFDPPTPPPAPPSEELGYSSPIFWLDPRYAGDLTAPSAAMSRAALVAHMGLEPSGLPLGPLGPATKENIYSGGGSVNVRKFDVGGTLDTGSVANTPPDFGPVTAPPVNFNADGTVMGTSSPDTASTGIAMTPAAPTSAPVITTTTPPATNSIATLLGLPATGGFGSMPQPPTTLAGGTTNGFDTTTGLPSAAALNDKTYQNQLSAYTKNLDQADANAMMAATQTESNLFGKLGSPEAQAEERANADIQRQRDATDYKYGTAGLPKPVEVQPPYAFPGTMPLTSSPGGVGQRYALVSPQQQYQTLLQFAQSYFNNARNQIAAAKAQAAVNQPPAPSLASQLVSGLQKAGIGGGSNASSGRAGFASAVSAATRYQ